MLVNGNLIEALKALGDPLRLRIVSLLSQAELAVGELAEVLGIAQPRVSHHLKLLRDSRLVQVRREGAWTFCRLASPGDSNPGPGLLRALETFSQELAPRREDLGRLERVLEARRERSRAFFEAAAGRGEPLEPRLAGSGLRHQAISLLLSPGLVVADVGCGSGFMTRTLATRAGRVILVDHSPAMLERARRNLGEGLEAALEFRVGELDALPLADGEVDGIFANLVLHHVPDLKKTLTELARTVRPGGILVISDLLPHEEEWFREEQADLRLGLDPGEVTELARQAGFGTFHEERGVDTLQVRSRDGLETELPLFVLKAIKPS